MGVIALEFTFDAKTAAGRYADTTSLMRLQNIAIFLLLVASIALRLGHGCSACQVPVFRYALERWNPQPFEITVFSARRALSADQLATAHALESLVAAGQFSHGRRESRRKQG